MFLLWLRKILSIITILTELPTIEVSGKMLYNNIKIRYTQRNKKCVYTIKKNISPYNRKKHFYKRVFNNCIITDNKYCKWLCNFYKWWYFKAIIFNFYINNRFLMILLIYFFLDNLNSFDIFKLKFIISSSKIKGASIRV